MLRCDALVPVRHSYTTELRDRDITGRLYLANTNQFGGVLQKKKKKKKKLIARSAIANSWYG